MGSFNFKWPHAAEEVYVTGTFDNWSKSEQLEKNGDVFEKTVTLPDASEKIYYKFVVDGTWTTDHTAPQEKDEGGNENNVLLPENIIKDAVPAAGAAAATAAIMSTVTPDSTTVALAKDVPLEKEEKGDLPGTFPETPAADLEKEFKVNPLPAADGAVNPVKLAPGDKIPESLQAEGINSNVKLDKESYEKSDAIPGIVTALPVPSGTMIPESSLPMGTKEDMTINTVTPASTTAALAAKVPLEEHKAPEDVTINTVTPASTTAALAAEVPVEEPDVPEVVKESQEEAGVEPGASGLSEEVKEKEQVEEELKEKVPEAPATSEGTAGKGTEKSEGDKTLVETAAAAAASVVAAGGAVLASVVSNKDKAVEQASSATTEAATQLPDSVKEQLPASAQEAIASTTQEEKREEVSPEVPAEVKESIAEAGEDPEAAANTTAVEDKKIVEEQLLKEVKPVEATEESSTTAAATAAATPAAETTEVNGAKAPTEATTKPSEDTETTKPAATKPAESGSATDKKKKHRISQIFNKLRHKVSSKDKA